MRPFSFSSGPHIIANMQTLFDPLAKLTSLGAYAHLCTAPDGATCVTLTYARTSTRKAQHEAQAIVTKFERLLLLQLDVPSGHRPRTVQQLVASGRVRVVGGRFILAR